MLLGVSRVCCNLDPSAIASQVMCDEHVCQWWRTAEDFYVPLACVVGPLESL